MIEARNLLKKLGAKHWGFPMPAPVYVDTLSDQDIVENLTSLCSMLDEYNEIYSRKIDDAIKALEWKEHMGK